MKRFLIETAFIFASCYVFTLLIDILYRTDFKLIMLKWALLDGFVYGGACWLIFLFSKKLFRSDIIFGLVSIFAAATLFKLSFDSAFNIHLNSRVRGITLFENGAPTIFGILDMLANPLTLMAVYASVLMVKALLTHCKNSKNAPQI